MSKRGIRSTRLAVSASTLLLLAGLLLAPAANAMPSGSYQPDAPSSEPPASSGDVVDGTGITPDEQVVPDAGVVLPETGDIAYDLGLGCPHVKIDPSTGRPFGDPDPKSAISYVRSPNCPTATDPAAVPFGQPFAGTGDVADLKIDGEPAVPPDTNANPVTTDGSVTPNGIIGTDDMTQINATTVYPWSAVVRVTYDLPNGNSTWCTGFVYARAAIAMAAHCMWDNNPSPGALFTNFVVTAGVNGSSTPFPPCAATSFIHFNPNYKTQPILRYDYGAIRVNCNIGDVTGFFGFTNPGGSALTVVGYPQNHPTKTMWRSTGTKLYQDTIETRYDNDTLGGDSGAPVFQTGVYLVQAIHTAGSTSHNAGATMTASRQNDFDAWK